MILSTLELIHIQYAALYNLDQHGRMLSVNDEPDGSPAPQFFMARTVEGNFYRFHADLPADLVATLSDICSAEPITSDFEPAPLYATAIRSLLGTHVEEYRGPAYQIPETVPQVPGAVIVQPEQVNVFQEHYNWLIEAYIGCGPIAAVVHNGSAVSVCFSSRSRLISAEAGLDTIEAFRRRGYARATTAAWAHEVQAQGRIAFYGTSWDNSASRSVARSLGLRLIGENWSVSSTMKR
jgi:GNAT acetyltransferase